jgi:hypothetical protein
VQWEVADANRAIVHVGKPRLSDLVDVTGFASATATDETDFATEYDLRGRFEVVSVFLRATSSALENLEGDFCEGEAVSEFLRP